MKSAHGTPFLRNDFGFETRARARDTTIQMCSRVHEFLVGVRSMSLAAKRNRFVLYLSCALFFFDIRRTGDSSELFRTIDSVLITCDSLGFYQRVIVASSSNSNSGSSSSSK